ncbi:MAG: recombinase zinc ribbon domain-containing protein [Acidimicrobiales bacterium]
MGAAARGKRHRHRYYVCWTRSRYGNAACSGERIRADALEAAVFDALVEFYAHPDALAGVLAEGRQQSAAAARQHDKEGRAVDAEVKRTEAALERYMHAFENGALTENLFAERVRELGIKAAALRARHAELLAATIDTPDTPTTADLRALHRWLRNKTKHAPDVERKAVARAFVHELRVEARDRVRPTFNLRPSPPAGNSTVSDTNPDGTGVRAVTPYVEVVPPHTNHHVAVPGAVIALRRNRA